MNSQKDWGMYCHLAVFLGVIIPAGNIIGPLVIWLMKKDEYESVNDQGREVVNFQITLTIAFAVSYILSFIFIGYILMGILFVIGLVYTILGIIKSSDGILFRYPYSYKFIK